MISLCDFNFNLWSNNCVSFFLTFVFGPWTVSIIGCSCDFVTLYVPENEYWGNSKGVVLPKHIFRLGFAVTRSGLGKFWLSCNSSIMCLVKCFEIASLVLIA